VRIIFFGTAEFGVPSLCLLHKHYTINCVITNPDKPAGRGQQLMISPIKKRALELNIPIIQPESLKDIQFIEYLDRLNPDIFVVVAFRILPPEVYKIAKHGAFNLHASLLPKYRGAAPIQWAIMNGENETGVTTFFLEETVDTGSIILQARIPIGLDETAGELHDRLAEVGAEVVLHTVRLIEIGKAKSIPQDASSSSKAPKILNEDCRIQWKLDAASIHNFIRALSPKPGAFTFHKDIKLKIYRTKIIEKKSHRQPGEVIDVKKGLLIATGQNAIEVLQIQKEGKKILPTEEFLHGYHINIGDVFS